MPFFAESLENLRIMGKYTFNKNIKNREANKHGAKKCNLLLAAINSETGKNLKQE